jgi:hypothetical protein
MNADVYTDPPSNTYMLGTKFSISIGGKSIDAIAVSSDSFPIILALYTIIIQFLFVAIWQLIAMALLISLKLNDCVNLVGMVGFWNCSDPLSAAFISLEYLAMVFFRSGIRKWRYCGPALLMSGLAIAIASLSLGIGIKYPDWLQVADAAPVHPSSVFWSYYGEVTDNVAIQIYTHARPGILRAMGSAEAGDLNSKLPNVKITPVPRSDSSVTQPQEQIDYGYSITAEDFGLQQFPDLVVNVQGSCGTDYSWSHRLKSVSGEDFVYDYYWPWGNSSGQTYPAATEMNPAYRLDFVTWLHPDIDQPSQHRNRSFAFLAATAMAPSTNPSSDPWYYTEPSTGDAALGFQYVVQSRRPVLTCWETVDICTGGECYDSYLDSSPLPAGLVQIFQTRFAHPAMTRVSISAGVNALKSYTGSASGSYVDAGASTLYSDMTRLILTGYLSSRQIFQEIAVMPKPSQDARSSLDASAGQLLGGAASFVVRTNRAVALRYDLVLFAPIFAGILWLLVGLAKVVKRQGDHTRFSIRAAALTATQLFRQLDERLTGDEWKRKKAMIPWPPEVKPVAGHGKIEVEYTSKLEGYPRQGPEIRFPGETEMGRSSARQSRSDGSYIRISGGEDFELPNRG